MKMTRATDYPSSIDLICALCGVRVSSLGKSEQICREMDFDSRICPHCSRMYGEARREEGLLFTSG